MTASIWAPGSNTITVNAENASLLQKYTAKAAQTVFLLTAFTYIPSTGSIRVYRNGVKLPGSEVSETDSTHFTLLLSQPLVAGECIECAAVLGSQDAVTAAAISAAASAAEAVAAAASAASAVEAAEAAAASADATDAISAAISAAASAAASAASVTNTVKKTSDTGSAKLPAGPTSERDAAPELGWTRFNTTLGRNETWNGTLWASSIDSANPVFTGVLTTEQRINIAASYGALQVNGADVLRFGSDSSGQLAGFRNVIINGNFQVNQRGYVSGAAVGTGLYAHDRWKMATSADTYIYSTVNNVTTVTIPAGKVLRQVIEGVNLQSGTYTLSWSGTAQGKIGAGAYGASGITGTAVGGTNLTIEFGQGTVSKVQLEFGSIASTFEFRPIGTELALCQRYRETQAAQSNVNYTPGGVSFVLCGSWAVEKCASPTISLSSTVQINTVAASSLAPTKSWIAGLSSGGAPGTVAAVVTGTSEL